MTIQITNTEIIGLIETLTAQPIIFVILSQVFVLEIVMTIICETA